jgi:hypothetical protein
VKNKKLKTKLKGMQMSKRRINGITTPFGGLSWDTVASATDFYRNLFVYLESKRILTTPMAMEKKRWSIDSVLEIKKTLTDKVMPLQLSKSELSPVKSMIDACNEYLDNVNPLDLQGIIYKNGNKWSDSTFDSAMKTFRNSFRTVIADIEKKYKLNFNKNIPYEY